MLKIPEDLTPAIALERLENLPWWQLDCTDKQIVEFLRDHLTGDEPLQDILNDIREFTYFPNFTIEEIEHFTYVHIIKLY